MRPPPSRLSTETESELIGEARDLTVQALTLLLSSRRVTLAPKSAAALAKAVEQLDFDVREVEEEGGAAVSLNRVMLIGEASGPVETGFTLTVTKPYGPVGREKMARTSLEVRVKKGAAAVPAGATVLVEGKLELAKEEGAPQRYRVVAERVEVQP